MRSLIPASLVATSLALVMAACGGSTTTTPTTPTPTTGPLVTDNFTGTLTTSGSETKTFPVGIGAVTVTLTNLTPLTTASIGMIVGAWDAANSACSAILQNDNTKVGNALVGTAVSALTLCVRTYDVGNIPEGTTYSYTFTVSHY